MKRYNLDDIKKCSTNRSTVKQETNPSIIQALETEHVVLEKKMERDKDGDGASDRIDIDDHDNSIQLVHHREEHEKRKNSYIHKRD